MYRRGDIRYPALREGAVWNGVVPNRFPASIARPTSRAEVAPLVRDAAARGERVAIRSGGHSWRGPSLRDDSLLLDLGDLNRVAIEAEDRIARVEPGATHQVMAEAIVPHGLAFPIGHCPSVGLGGYMLAGGLGWNPREWGPACWNLAALEVVTVEGEELLVDDSHHPDLFWAGRGGGSAFPAIATRYHLQLQPLPHIASVRGEFPLAQITELLPWSATVEDMPSGIEVSLIAHRPVDPATGAPLAPVAAVQASGFAESPERAGELAAMAADAVPGTPLARRSMPTVSLEGLEGEGAWTEGLRYAADSCWVEGDYESIAAIGERAIAEAPSPRSRVVFAWTFPHERTPDVAATVLAPLSVNFYAIWEHPADDASNETWVRENMERLAPWTNGFYVGEADLSDPERPRRCYTPEKWARLQAIRDSYDPNRRKHGYLSEP